VARERFDSNIRIPFAAGTLRMLESKNRSQIILFVELWI